MRYIRIKAFFQTISFITQSHSNTTSYTDQNNSVFLKKNSYFDHRIKK